MLRISAREKQVLWFDYVAYTGNILETRVGAMMVSLSNKVDCVRNCTRRHIRVGESAFGPVLYSAPNGFCPILTFALKTNISCFELI